MSNVSTTSEFLNDPIVITVTASVRVDGFNDKIREDLGSAIAELIATITD